MLIYILFLLSFKIVDALYCIDDIACEKKFRVGSKCVNYSCTNPFQQGCLRQYLGEAKFHKKRICNSHDPLGSDETGLCEKSLFDYPEIRIGGQNWDSALMAAWVLQVFLSEILGVPASIETSASDRNFNFYDKNNAFGYPKMGYDYDALKLGNKIGDCRLANIHDSDSYTPCANLLLEAWNGQFQFVKELETQNVLMPSEGLGGVGKISWFIPKFVVAKDPSLQSYLSMTGNENREKMARTFLRPTTWKDYCYIVSGNNCTGDDGTAVRAPENKIEESKYFLNGLYKGHFRKTEKNDCASNPNCTGHFVNVDCAWSNVVFQQAYHLDIAIDSDGPITSTRGYSYSNMIQIWEASAATNSSVLMYGWTPDPLINQFSGLDSEPFMVSLPNPTQNCSLSRVSIEDRCSDDPIVQAGSKYGACDSESHSYQKLITMNLYTSTYKVDPARRSPGYQAVKAFKITDLEVSQIFDLWYGKNIDKWGYDARDAVCEWVANNLDTLASFVPITYPREIANKKAYDRPFLYVALMFSLISALFVLATSYLVYRYRGNTVINYASVDFLFMVLVGLFISSINAIITTIMPSKAVCITRSWTLVFGYTLQLIPLIIKLGATNKVYQASKKLKRVIIQKKKLYGLLFCVVLISTIFLTAWTVVDPFTIQTNYELQDPTNEISGNIVKLYSRCGSDSEYWYYASLAWNFTLLVCALVLAFQTRNLPASFNESQKLAFAMCSKGVFTLFLVSSMLLDDVLPPKILDGFKGLVMSLDVITFISIYFVPKFFILNKRERRSNSIVEDISPLPVNRL